MDNIVHRVLRFDRFALDLSRACLRAGDQEIELRPKTYEVLHYLVENAGRLVSKQELFEAVWLNVSVCDDSLVQCIRARFADLGSRLGWGNTCRSDTTAYGPLPVGSFKPNPWGIFDMHGNSWEWVEDCWTPIASEIPTDGSAFSRLGNCEVGVMRGGSWAAGRGKVRSATRAPVKAAAHYHHIGFRVALSLAE
jgi:hypothetical protein